MGLVSYINNNIFYYNRIWLLYNEDKNLAAISSSVDFVRFGCFQFGSSILDNF